MIFYVLRKFRSDPKSDWESNLGPLKSFDPSTRKVVSAGSWSELLVLLVKLRVDTPKSDGSQWSPNSALTFCRMLTPRSEGLPTKSDLLQTAEKIHSGEYRTGNIGAFVGQIIMALGDDDEDPMLVLDPSRESDKKALRELGIF